MTKVRAVDLKVGDLLRGNVVVMGVIAASLKLPTNKVQVALKHPNREDSTLATWGKFTKIAVFNR